MHKKLSFYSEKVEENHEEELVGIISQKNAE